MAFCGLQAHDVTPLLQLKTKLIKLDMSCNNLGDEGAALIANLTELTELDMSGNNVGQQGLAYIARRLPFVSLDSSTTSLINSILTTSKAFKSMLALLLAHCSPHDIDQLINLSISLEACCQSYPTLADPIRQDYAQFFVPCPYSGCTYLDGDEAQSQRILCGFDDKTAGQIMVTSTTLEQLLTTDDNLSGPNRRTSHKRALSSIDNTTPLINNPTPFVTDIWGNIIPYLTSVRDKQSAKTVK